MLGRCVRAKIVRSIGSKDETGFTYPYNYGKIYDENEQYAIILGIDHPVKNFDGRIIAALEPKNIPKNKDKSTIWILAPKSSRYINLDIMRKLRTARAFPDYDLKCLYESSSGAIIFREINSVAHFLIIRNKRSAHWGFPKGHLEMGETTLEAAKREVLEETGIHANILEGFEGISQYKIRNTINKCVTIYVGSTLDKNTVIQDEEIDDFAWLPYRKAMSKLRFRNDRRILYNATKFLVDNGYILAPEDSYMSQKKGRKLYYDFTQKNLFKY